MEKLIKAEIKDAYANVAKGQIEGECCESTACCSPAADHTMAVDYRKVEGYQEIADLALGCGIPTDIAKIKRGDTVVDLGSGAGNDVFVARQIVGEEGRVIGVDMTPEMVILALKNSRKLGFENVDFVLNDIENMTDVPNDIADVVVSNCVLNLVSDKKQVFGELSRILKVGGHFSISDIVYTGHLPASILGAAELYAGCVAGASEKGAYLGYIKAAGFKNIQISKERKIELPDEFLLNHISKEELTVFKASKAGIYSITVYADKLEEGNCCRTTDTGCCGSEVDTKEEVLAPIIASCCGTESKNKTSCC